MQMDRSEVFRHLRAAVIAAGRTLSPTSNSRAGGMSPREVFVAAFDAFTSADVQSFFDNFTQQDPTEGPPVKSQYSLAMLTMEAMVGSSHMILVESAHGIVADEVTGILMEADVIGSADRGPLRAIILALLKQLGKVAVKAALFAIIKEVLEWIKRFPPHTAAGVNPHAASGTGDLPATNQIEPWMRKHGV